MSLSLSEVPMPYKTIHSPLTKRPTFVSFTRHILSLFEARGREYIMFYYQRLRLHAFSGVVRLIILSFVPRSSYLRVATGQCMLTFVSKFTIDKHSYVARTALFRNFMLAIQLHISYYLNQRTVRIYCLQVNKHLQIYVY